MSHPLSNHKTIYGCLCDSIHILSPEDYAAVLELAARTDPMEITAPNGMRMTVDPLTVALHGGLPGGQ